MSQFAMPVRQAGAMLHKIRSVMGLRDDEYSLDNEIELDDGFFETVSSVCKKTRN